MSSKTISYILPVSIASALAALLLAGTGLSSLAQLSSDARQDLSGTINSLVQEDGEATYIIGGEWNLSLDGDKVSDFSADLAMAKSDGTGAHAHRIVMADGQDTIELADERSGTVEVTLTPTEQTVGSTVLVEASGLGNNSETVVKIGDMIAGNTQSDADGNLLFAVGITDDITGSQTVTVEDEANSGSASFSVMKSENVTSTQPSNLTSTEPTGNLTDTQQGNVTSSPTSDQDEQTTYGTTIQGQSYGSDAIQDSTTSDTTTGVTEDIAAGEVFEDMPGFLNTTSDSGNTTSTDTESSVVAETNGNSTSFEVLADIYSNDELKWEDVSITVTVMNDQVIMMEIDPAATENHFGDQPIFGMADM